MDEGFLLLWEVVWGGGEPDSLNASASKDSRGEDAGRAPHFVAAPPYYSTEG